jgi:iron complex outermembrane receptor protein
MALVMFSASGYAQAQQAQTAQSGAQQLEEVVVTARKVSEKALDVPLTVTAISAQRLKDSNIQDLQGILSLVPGATLYGTESGTNQAPVIRGAFDQVVAGVGRSNVATFVDGVFIENSSAISMGLVDLDRVEIIEGPTSAIYGRSGFNGAINYITKKPTDTAEADGDISYGQYGRLNLLADVNGPIIPGVLRAGLGIKYATADGDYQDAVTGLRAGGYNQKDIRANVDWTPTSKLDISAGYYYGDDVFDQDPLVTAANGEDGRVIGQYVANPIQVGAFPSQANDDGNKRRVQNANLKFDYDLGWATVTDIVGYNRVTQFVSEDFVGLRNGLTFPDLLLGPGGTYTGKPDPAHPTSNVLELFGSGQNTEDTSEEIRIASKQNQALRWSVGADYYQSRYNQDTLIGLNGSDIPSGDYINVYGFNDGFVTPYGAFSKTMYTEGDGQESNYSIFGTLDYDVTNKLTALGEVRVTRDNQQEFLAHNSFIPSTYNPYGLTGPAEAHYIYANYRVTLKYKITSDINAYGSVATGEKPGGFNPQASPPLVPYAPETNTTYELGIKSSFFQHKLALNADIYHIVDRGLQVYSYSPGFIFNIANQGTVHNTGFEGTAVYSPVQMASFSVGFAYTDPTYASNAYDALGGFYACSIIPSCAARIDGTKGVSLKGFQEQFTSKYSLTAAADLHGPLVNSLTWYAHGDYRYSSKQYIDAENLGWVGDINLLNFAAGVKWGNYKVGFYLKNALDEQVPDLPNTATELNGTTSYIAELPPRRNFGINASVKY